MEILVCEWCDRLFQSKGYHLCEACKIEDMKRFSKVSEFIRDSKNREATLKEVVEATGVEEVDISRYIQEGRLIVKSMPNLQINCIACGKLTNEGRLCRGCRNHIGGALDGLSEGSNGSNGRVSTYRLD